MNFKHQTPNTKHQTPNTKHQTPKRRLSLRFLLLLMLIAFVNCQKEEITKELQTENQEQTSNRNLVSAGDIPEVMEFLRNRSNDKLEFKFEANKTNTYTNTSDPHENDIIITQAMEDEIVQVVQDGKSNYAFKTKEKFPNYFLNLIVVQTNYGYYMYFTKYVPSLEVYWDGKSIDDFEGAMYVYSDTGKFREKSYYSNGTRALVPCECSIGGGGDDICHTETWVICNFRNSVHQNEFECGCQTSPYEECSGFTPVFVEVCTGGIYGIETNNINYTTEQECYCWIDNPSGGGGGGTGGGNNNCPNAEPCDDFEVYDANCECVSNSNPIIPINPTPNYGKDINICLGSNFTIDEINTLNTNPTIDQLYNYMFDDFGNCNPENPEFAEVAAEVLLEGGEFDEEEMRINGIKLDSTIPPCLQDKILDLMFGNFPYSESMGNIELIEDTFSSLGGSYSPSPIDIVVTYKMANISGNGRTQVDGYDSATQTINISITIDEDLVNNGTKLAIVKTILHESIHAYLLKLRQEYPSYFGTSKHEFSQLVLDYESYTDANDPQHIYMARIITNIANNISNFVQEKYDYPPSTIDYYEAVCWSGVTHLTDGTLNPLFVNNYPNYNDQQNIIKIFNTENGTATYTGYSPLIDNNCN